MAGTTRQSRELKKWIAARRAQKRLAVQFDMIDWNEDVLGPEVEALLAGKVRLEIESASDLAAHSIIHVSVDLPEDDADTADVVEVAE